MKKQFKTNVYILLVIVLYFIQKYLLDKEGDEFVVGGSSDFLIDKSRRRTILKDFFRCNQGRILNAMSYKERWEDRKITIENTKSKELW